MDAPNQSCFRCQMRPDRVFCDLPADALQEFDSVKTLSRVSRGEQLFSEGRLPRGVYVLCEGRAKLSICGENRRRLMLRVAGPGEVLGLSASVSGKPYELTAEMMDSSQVAFIRRRDLLRFLRQHPEACQLVVYLLSEDLHHAYEKVRSVGLNRGRHFRLTRTRA